MYFFQVLGVKIDEIFAYLETGVNSTMMQQLSILIAISITLFVMYKGFQTLLGKSKDPIRELIWDLFMKVIAITFALNVDGWLTLVTEAMNGLHTWAGGGVSLFSELDALANIDLETGEIKKDFRKLSFIRLGTSGALQADIPVDSVVLSSHGLGLDGLLHYYVGSESVMMPEAEEAFIKHVDWSPNKSPSQNIISKECVR